MVIMLDDEDRENEGDLVYSAALSTPELVNFMVTHAKGLVCVSVSSETAKRLELFPMVSNNTSSYETAFTVSVDDVNAATGISAIERDNTIKILANPISKAIELVRPGHIFPLIAKDGGVLVRTGHTEGSDDLYIFAAKHNLKQIYISDLVEYRLANETLVSEVSSNEILFFGKEAIKKEFKDHLENIHTVILFGKEEDVNHVKFHTIRPDIKIFLHDNKLKSILKNINFLK